MKTFAHNQRNHSTLRRTGADLLWPPDATGAALSMNAEYGEVRALVTSPEFLERIAREFGDRQWARAILADPESLVGVVRRGDRTFVNSYLAATIRRVRFGGLLAARGEDVMSEAFAAWTRLVRSYRPVCPFGAWIAMYLGGRLCRALAEQFPVMELKTVPLDGVALDGEPQAREDDREARFLQAALPSLCAASANALGRRVIRGWLYSGQSLPEIAGSLEISHTRAWRIVQSVVRSTLLTTRARGAIKRVDLSAMAKIIASALPAPAFEHLIPDQQLAGSRKTSESASGLLANPARNSPKPKPVTGPADSARASISS